MPLEKVVAQKEFIKPSKHWQALPETEMGVYLGEKSDKLPKASLRSLREWDCCHHDPTETLPKKSFFHKPKLRVPRPTQCT